jgi:hypothetical protein
MAKKSKKGPGRGRSASEKDPATGRFKTKTTSPTTTSTTVTAAPPAPAAAPAGPTVTPEQITEEISGFRKALLQTMNDLGGEQSELQDAVLDGLRQTAEVLVSENENIFGKRYDKTVDQSAAYEILESVVRLGEMAVRAKTVQEKRKILQRLQTYKKVTNKVFGAGGGRESAIAGKILEMIAKIEKPLSKESGVKAAAKEKITDFAKKIPERMAAKIPLIGGILSRSLQSRRERKEEEAEALSTLTGEISQAGRTSLYGRRGGAEIEPSPSLMGGVDTTPPIPGGTTVSKIMGGGKTNVGFGGKAVIDTLSSILVQVKDIKSILVDQYDPAQEELKKEEAKREAEDKLTDILKSIKGGKEAPKAGEEAKKGGILESLSSLFSGGIGGAVQGILASLSGMATTVASTLAGLALPALGVMAAAAGGAAVGYSLYKTWIEPSMDQAQSEREAVLAKKTETTKRAITTDTGEAVYAVDMMGENTVMTEAEIKGKIATASPEEKVELEKALIAGPMQQIVDTSTGIRVDAFSRFKSGESIEQFKQREKADTEARRSDPGAYRFNVLKDAIAKFDDKTRTEWKQMQESGATFNARETKASIIKNEAEVLYNSITKGGASNPLTEDQKEKLLDMSNIVTDMGQGQFLEIGDVDNVIGVGTAFKMFQGEQSEEVKQRIKELRENTQTDYAVLEQQEQDKKADPTAVALPPLPPVPEQIPPFAGTIEKTTPAAAIPEASNGKAPIQREIDTINEEMRKLEVAAQDPDPSNPYTTIEGQNKLNTRRAELNTRRQSLYTQMYSMESGTIVPPSTPSTDVGRTTMQLDSARDAAEQAKQADSAPAPTVNAVNAPKTTNNAITVNNNTGAGVRNNDPTLKSAERASL